MNDGTAGRLKSAWEALDLNDFRFAETSAREVLTQSPQDGEALYLLGSALLFEGRLQEAVAPLRAAAALLTQRTVQYRLAHCLFGLGDLNAAEAALRREIFAFPDYASAHNTLGAVLAAQGRKQEALDALLTALRADPCHAEAAANAGAALHELGRDAEALPLLRQAAAAGPQIAQVQQNLGIVLHALQRYEEAAAAFKSAQAIDPHLAYALSSQIWAELFACDWREVGLHVEQMRRQARDGRIPVTPFVLLAVTDSAAEQLKGTQAYLQEIGAGAQLPLQAVRRVPTKRIRIAYLSFDFRQHAVAALISRLFELHDRQAFEVIGYSYGPDDGSPMRARLGRAFDRFIDGRHATNEDAARHLVELGVDIAIDLNGHTEGSRIGMLARRPAPVQVTYLGYPATTGLPYIDYVLADRIVIPPEEQVFYTEKLVYLPGCYQVNDDQISVDTQPPPRNELGLPDNSFVFCAFNNAYKLRPDVFDSWMRLLAAVPESVLWLLQGSPEMERNLREHASARGIAAQRLVFAPKRPLGEHLARHRRADLFLDTLPYNAHTTASDALRMGLPIVTCLGTTFAGRVAASLLTTLGLPELVTNSRQDYEALALEFARNPKALAEVRTKLASNLRTHALFNSSHACRNIETAYRTMWERHLRGDPPIPFSVPTHTATT
jgi:predicted O-linked N-acetylglucosamine transferase (SPINDLY family)